MNGFHLYSTRSEIQESKLSGPALLLRGGAQKPYARGRKKVSVSSPKSTWSLRRLPRQRILIKKKNPRADIKACRRSIKMTPGDKEAKGTGPGGKKKCRKTPRGKSRTYCLLRVEVSGERPKKKAPIK